MTSNDAQRFLDLGRKYGAATEANQFYAAGRSVDEFLDFLITKKLGGAPASGPGALIGLSERQIQGYSITRALNRLARHEPLDGLEAECSQEVSRNIRQKPRGFFVPSDLGIRIEDDGGGRRALSAGSQSAGGYTVETQLVASQMAELLRKRAVVSQLGATTLSGLVGDIAIPRHTGGATAYWLGENASVTASDQTFGQLALTPHRVSAQTIYSKQLLAQSSLDVEGFVRNDLAAVIAVAKDAAAISGSGTNGEPLGILNTTGINSVTFGGAATFAKMVDFETEVAKDNAARATGGAYLTTSNVRGKLKTKEVVTSTGIFIWQNGLVNGYRAEVSENVPDDKVLFGFWSDLIIADWDGLDIVVNPFSLDSTNQVRVTVTAMCDVGIRHVESFCASTDSGAQ